MSDWYVGFGTETKTKIMRVHRTKLHSNAFYDFIQTISVAEKSQGFFVFCIEIENMNADVMRVCSKGISLMREKQKNIYVIVEKQTKNLSQRMNGACATHRSA